MSQEEQTKRYKVNIEARTAAFDMGVRMSSRMPVSSPGEQ